ncbi:hypothetical protein [Chitinophaga barathri]|uniref:Galactose oxidase n=1 Tax=Chitinophaga barathri TaxID=1647451 RepID=A0A3N4M8F6_9BACT|nr:hypothetical protein [Chitinophaga barathri]RPD39904.1 hypothetical protein EG028_17420 [Chitinophaga barathri]
MKGFFLIVFCLLFNGASTYAQSHGLVFSSFEAVQEKRTSLDLGGGVPLCLSSGFSLSFDISFLPGQPAYFGYVFRLINQEHQNIDLLYSPNTGAFNLVVGEQLSGISFHVENQGPRQQWNRFRLTREGGELAFYVNGKLCGKTNADLKDDCFYIIFGACNYPDFRSTDLPPMQVRNISLEKDGRPDAYWPLRETAGNVAMDSLRGQKAIVTNATWAAALHLHWQPRYDAVIKGHASVAFDAEREELIIVGKDSIYRYAEKSGATHAEPVKDPRHQLLLGSHTFLNPDTRGLWQFNIDHFWAAAFRDGSWQPPFDSIYVTEYWQANRFYSSSSRSIYFLGGYGQYRYKNRISRYDFNTAAWDSIRPNGDNYTPRYLAALGSVGDTAYILGGFGSTTGEQMLNPRYLYDMLRLDVRTGAVKKLFTLDTPKEQFVFGNSMVIDTAARCYYALIFPNDRYDSRLQLIKGSLGAPGYTLLADTIPFEFKDTRAFAGLFFCAASKRLLAVTTFTKENRHTRVKIYSIAFPPEQLPVTGVKPPPFRIPWWYYMIGLMFLLFALLLSVRTKRRRKKRKEGERPHSAFPLDQATVAEGYHHGNRKPAHAVPRGDEAAGKSYEGGTPGNRLNRETGPSGGVHHGNEAGLAVHPATIQQLPEGVAPGGRYETHPQQEDIQAAGETPPVSWIYLFGNFTVKDAAGQDFTRQFTPLLKELFLLIAVHTIENGHGISVEKLNEILWNDKSDKAAKNNRSVNILKLKNILEKLGTFGIRKESGNWRLDMDQSVYIDLRDLHRLAPKDFNGLDIREMLYIVMRGPFLYQTEYEWLDDFKSEISGRLLDRLSREAAGGQWNDDPELLIAVANCMFVLDQVNEQALAIKCRSLVMLGRHSLARHAYERFVKEYRHIYGEEYPQSFNDILH